MLKSEGPRFLGRISLAPTSSREDAYCSGSPTHIAARRNQVASSLGKGRCQVRVGFDGRQLEFPANDKQNSRSTTIRPNGNRYFGAGAIGHRQAGSEVVCVDDIRGEPRDSCIQGGDGCEAGTEVPPLGPCAE